MMKRKLMLLISAVFLVLSMLAGCSKNNDESNTATTGNKDPKDIKGNITVITQRTDIVNSVFKDYAKEFNKTYPNVKVTFQALSDYEGQIKVRMNSKDYGDVLLIPTSIPIADIPSFFEPLGDLKEMQNKYSGIEERAVSGKVYGIPIAINYSGIVYNKKVFADAGVTDVPKTPDQFIAALKQIKAKTKATPLYTNYADGWPLTQWEANLPTVAGDPDYVNIEQPNTDDNFVKGKPHYELYKMMFDAANQGLIEKDPTTTNWETSKGLMGKGEVATMVLGSWAIGQIKGVATNPDDIGYMPSPTNADTQFFPTAADYNLGISKNSENKAAARAWVDWFIEKSNYPVEQAFGISPVKSAPLPEDLKKFQEEGVKFLPLTPAKEGQEGLVDKIDKEAEVGLWQPDFKKRIIEAAIGNTKESYDDIMKDLNNKWVKARATVGK
jgi:raffinose/stachyose/melibiose transport system substrate-binding protein